MLDIHNLTFVTRRLSRSRGGGVARVYTVPNGNAELGLAILVWKLWLTRPLKNMDTVRIGYTSGISEQPLPDRALSSLF